MARTKRTAMLRPKGFPIITPMVNYKDKKDISKKVQPDALVIEQLGCVRELPAVK